NNPMHPTAQRHWFSRAPSCRVTSTAGGWERWKHMCRIFTICLIVAFSCRALAEPAMPTGVYSTVSESEWETELTLQPSRAPRIRPATWEAGKGAHPKLETIKGTWSSTNEGISIVFKPGTLNLRFDRQLPFSDFGRKGAAPGF